MLFVLKYRKDSNFIRVFFLRFQIQNFIIFLNNLAVDWRLLITKQIPYMDKTKFFVLILMFSSATFYSQNAKGETSIGFHYGFGNEIKNSNYTYTNNYYKVQVSYLIKETNHFKYELVLQPELNFATHQLLNFHFVTPEETNYIEKREKYTKLKDIKEYALGIGLRQKTDFKNR